MKGQPREEIRRQMQFIAYVRSLKAWVFLILFSAVFTAHLIWMH